jgi:hypothetical protein
MVRRTGSRCQRNVPAGEALGALGIANVIGRKKIREIITHLVEAGIEIAAAIKQNENRRMEEG